MKGLPRSLARANGQTTVQKLTLPIRNATVTVAATGAAVGFGTAVVGDLPEGNILFLGATGYIQATTDDADIGATWDGDFSLGTTPTADVTLDGTDVNLLPSTAFGAATAKASPRVRAARATAVVLDNTDGSLELNLNMLVDAANIADGASAAFTVNGDVQIAYIVLGDD